MGTTTDQIENDIRASRAELQSNFKDLEHKVKEATDWRQHYQKRTGAILAVAFGGGMLLSAIVGRKQSSRAAPASSASSSIERAPGPGRRAVSETLGTIQSALVGVAASKLKGMLGQSIPGFADQVAQAEAKKGHTSNGDSSERPSNGT
jgi:hypothetical protein